MSQHCCGPGIKCNFITNKNIITIKLLINTMTIYSTVYKYRSVPLKYHRPKRFHGINIGDLHMIRLCPQESTSYFSRPKHLVIKTRFENLLFTTKDNFPLFICPLSVDYTYVKNSLSGSDVSRTHYTVT